MLWCIIFMHKFSKTGWEICDFTLRSRLGFSYVIPGIIMSSWNTSNCYVTFPRDLLDFTVFSDMTFCQLFLPEWLCGVSMEYSGGFLKMLGIFPESFLLRLCLRRRRTRWCRERARPPQSPGAWPTQGEVRVALTFLWQDCTPFRASMNTKNVLSDMKKYCAI